jgi:hypothetical protein
VTDLVKADPDGLKPTVAQAKAAWETHAKPSLNNVLAVLHAAGFTGMSKSTLQRWQSRGWPEPKIPTREAAAAAKEVAAAVAKEATQKVVDDAEAAELEATTLDEADARAMADTALAVLTETATRESLIAQILVARRIQRHADRLVKQSPKDAAKLIEALKGANSNVTVVVPGSADTEPRTVGGNVIDHDTGGALTPLQMHIRDYRAQMKVVK